MIRLGQGSRESFEILYERYFSKLVWFASGFLNETPKAEDAVQEVFIRIIERPGMFDPGKKFSTWVYAVTANMCKQMLRNEQNRLRILKERVASESDHVQEANAGQFPGDKKLLQEKIKSAFETLNEKEKNIYTLRFEEEFSIKEIADVLQMPEGSVKSGIYYLLKKFALQLKDFSYE
jgi:RNA polymerase sigma-70 factor (ECF subfamily)